MKKILKFVFFSIGIIVFLIFGCYKYYEYKYKQNLKSENLNIFLEQIKNSKNLSQNFYNTYEEINPKSIEYDLFYSIIKKTECQSQRIARRIYPIVKKSNKNRIENLSFEYFLTREIEKNTTQKQCLNWNVENFDFMYNTNGIESASKFYFQKKLQNLSSQEIETLIKMLENPVKNNPLRK